MSKFFFFFVKFVLFSSGVAWLCHESFPQLSQQQEPDPIYGKSDISDTLLTSGPRRQHRAPPTLTRVLAAELDRRVTHVGHALAQALVAQIHAVRVAVAAPAHGNAQAVDSTLELVDMAAAWRTRGCKTKERNVIKKKKGQSAVKGNKTAINLYCIDLDGSSTRK